MKKRLLAFLLVLVMVVGFVPVTARGEDSGSATLGGAAPAAQAINAKNESAVCATAARVGVCGDVCARLRMRDYFVYCKGFSGVSGMRQ